MWTHFRDMNSGGRRKLQWKHIYIEAPQAAAEIIFYNRFKRNPNRITCTCCGPDYSISDEKDLAQITGFDRGCNTLKTPRFPDGRYDNDNPFLKEKYYYEIDESPPEGFEFDDEYTPLYDYCSLEDYIKRDNVLVIYRDDIDLGETFGSLPREGYVWAGGD